MGFFSYIKTLSILNTFSKATSMILSRCGETIISLHILNLLYSSAYYVNVGTIVLINLSYKSNKKSNFLESSTSPFIIEFNLLR